MGESSPKKALNPFPGDYETDLYMTDMLNDDQATYFQLQIRIF